MADAELDRFTNPKGESGRLRVCLRWLNPETSSRDEPDFVSGGDPQRDSGPWQSNGTGWFATGYGPTRRLTGETHKPQRSSPRVERLMQLFSSEVTLFEAVSWLSGVPPVHQMP